MLPPAYCRCCPLTAGMAASCSLLPAAGDSAVLAAVKGGGAVFIVALLNWTLLLWRAAAALDCAADEVAGVRACAAGCAGVPPGVLLGGGVRDVPPPPPPPPAVAAASASAASATAAAAATTAAAPTGARNCAGVRTLRSPRSPRSSLKAASTNRWSVLPCSCSRRADRASGHAAAGPASAAGCVGQLPGTPVWRCGWPHTWSTSAGHS
jgi:hypothetical protein